MHRSIYFPVKVRTLKIGTKRKSNVVSGGDGKEGLRQVIKRYNLLGNINVRVYKMAVINATIFIRKLDKKVDSKSSHLKNFKKFFFFTYIGS